MFSDYLTKKVSTFYSFVIIIFFALLMATLFAAKLNNLRNIQSPSNFQLNLELKNNYGE